MKNSQNKSIKRVQQLRSFCIMLSEWWLDFLCFIRIKVWPMPITDKDYNHNAIGEFSQAFYDNGVGAEQLRGLLEDKTPLAGQSGEMLQYQLENSVMLPRSKSNEFNPYYKGGFFDDFTDAVKNSGATVAEAIAGIENVFSSSSKVNGKIPTMPIGRVTKILE